MVDIRLMGTALALTMAIGFGASTAVAQPDVEAVDEAVDIPVATAVVGTSTLVGQA